MNQETNDFLRENLVDAHTIFENIIGQMQEANIPYDYEFLIQKEKNSYDIVTTLLHKMNNSVYEYHDLEEKNVDLINANHDIYFKYFMLYAISIIFIKIYHEIFNTGKFNEFWHYLLGLFFGSTFVGLINRDLNEQKYGTKEKRDLINRFRDLKEEYKKNHDDAVNEIDYIFALNDNLWSELDNGKKLIKNKS